MSLKFSSNDQYDRESTCGWFLFYINISQSQCLMDGLLSRLDPYTSPSDYQILYACYKLSQELLLELIFWSIIFFLLLTILALGVFLFWFLCLHPSSYDHNRSILNKRKLPDTFYSTCWLVYVYHACFDDTHDWIRRQDQHSTLHWKPRIQLMEKLFINNL